jgi:2-polyprenyl-6-methoxyphenol hydroxylase-like FAD-dependent oxidoreductase
MRRPWGPGWALVGDAGYWKDPISAHGLTDALRDAELLAGAIVGSFGAADSTVEDHWMGEYHRTRDRLSNELFDVTDRMASPSWTDDDIGLILRSLSAAMADEVSLLAELPPWPPVAATAGVGCR